jgi:PAS domain S-box-containing protein
MSGVAHADSEAGMKNEVLLDKEYINSIVSDMLDSLIVLDADGIIKTANRATLDLLGYKEEELIGRPLEDILPQDGGGAAFKDTGLKQLSKNGFIRGYEIAYRTKAGEEIPVILSGSIIYREASGSRAPMGIACVAHDMREIKKLHSELLQCDRLASLGTLSSGIAHEIKNPLAIIIQGLAFLKSSIPCADSLSHDAIARMEKAGLRAAKIVKDLLSFARQNPPALEALDIPCVIEETLSFIKHQINFKNIKIVRQFKPQLPLIKADASQMKQVFLNIILNAIEALKQGGSITIAVEQLRPETSISYLQIRFADTGYGISEKDLKMVFDPFFSTKQKQGGTGLGLSVAKGIVERHKGVIWIESKPGYGTTVIINLLVT